MEHIENYNHLLNLGIKSYGIKNVIDIINDFYNNYNKPIVSMGSGIGAIEYLSKIQNNNINWICIDINNNPIDFPSSATLTHPLVKIDYNSCDELIENKPEIINNCILFLNWCLPNDSYYDFEAIIKLNPIAILSIYEDLNGSNGAAGGKMFYNWTKNNIDYHLKEEYSLYADEYHDNDDELMDIRISWWQSNSLNDFDDVIFKGFPCIYNGNHKSQCCIQ